MNIKRIIAIMLTLALALSLTACGNNANNDGSSDSSDSSAEASTTGFVNDYEEYNISDYVTLGNYKNIEVTVDNSPVTDEDVDKLIKQDLREHATSTLELTEGVAQADDYVTMDYVGYVDGAAFNGGTAKNATVQLGSGDMIEGFEEALVGKNIGEEISINLKFADNYGSDEIKGKDVVFKVTMSKVTRYTYPELTDEFVTKTFGYDSVEEYKSRARAYLEKTRATDVEYATKEAIYQKILENSTIIELPSERVAYYADALYSQYELSASYNNYEDLESYLEATNGMTTEELTEYCEDYGENYVKKDLIMQAILEAENIEITDDMYDEMVEEYASSAGYSDVASYEQDNTNKSLSVNVIQDVAIEVAMETAIINYTNPQ